MGRAGVADRHAHRALELIGEFDDALAPCRQAMDAVDEVLSVGRGEQRDEVVGRLERGGKERRAVELDHRAHIVAVRLPTLSTADVDVGRIQRESRAAAVAPSRQRTTPRGSRTRASRGNALDAVRCIPHERRPCAKGAPRARQSTRGSASLAVGFTSIVDASN